MEKLPIDEIITQLDSKDIKKRNSAIQIVNSSIAENDQVLTLLIEQYYVSFSENVMQAIITLVSESRAQMLYDSLRSEFIRLPSDNLQPTLILLTNLLSRHDPEPTWMYLLVGHQLLEEMLTAFKFDSSFESMPLGIVFVSMLLPLATVRLEAYLEKLFSLLEQVLTVYQEIGSKPWEYIQRICFHYLVTLYSIYPAKLVAWAQTKHFKTPAGSFVLKYGILLKLHPALLQPASASLEDSCSYPHSMGDRESHDIIWEISCYTEDLDLLYEAKMIAGIKECEVTEMHDISWECADNAGRSIACQTSEMVDNQNKSLHTTISDSLISTYLDKTLVASAGMVQKRKNSHRFEHDSSEFSCQSAVVVLEGELMLEKYLRFQHERRNRRYLSQVRQCYDERSYNQVYRDEWERLKTELSNAENKVAELSARCEEERQDSQSQLFNVTEKLNKEMAVKKRENIELERNEKEYSSKVEALQQKVDIMATQLSDLQGVKGLIAEKQKQLDVVTDHNKALINKVKQLQNQVFVVNEIRSFQCDALNALKPYCFKTKNNGPYSSPVKETPDIANLQKLASETQRKFENTESEVKRLRSMTARMEEEIAAIKEKLAKQKNLTEKTTNFWEQKYSGLEKTCAAYKNTYNELCQKVLKLKRDLELRPF